LFATAAYLPIKKVSKSRSGKRTTSTWTQAQMKFPEWAKNAERLVTIYANAASALAAYVAK
jgi:hypothetical protein